MEGCKERALSAGLKFDKETLEYIVTNADMLELSPKNMIPTLYDHWMQEIQVLRGKGEYEYYPNNPYETVINTRPAISFYNDNNPDWLNVMIFYHVLAHIDFFQNNKFYEKTWDYDFKEKALTEKRMIARLRSQKGRQVEYVIEFARAIDNLVGYFDSLNKTDYAPEMRLTDKVDYYFNIFLQSVKNAGMNFYLSEIERYDTITEPDQLKKEDIFFRDILITNPEFEEFFRKYTIEKAIPLNNDLMQFIMEESKFLNTEDNKWMKGILEIIRDTSLYFSPQIRTKTMNEGWASYWHEKLFMMDDRIKGHEVAFARINAKVTALSKVGLNPYAIGWRLYMHIEDLVDNGKISLDFSRLKDIEERKNFSNYTAGKGRDFIFYVRQNYCDFTFLNSFIEQSFVDKHKLMVVGQRINVQKNSVEYFVKSRKADDYKQMIINTLYHPPLIKFSKKEDNTLHLEHKFEGKELYKEYINNTLIAIEYLWGDRVELVTTEIDWDKMKNMKLDAVIRRKGTKEKIEPFYSKVIYTVKNKKVSRQKIY